MAEPLLHTYQVGWRLKNSKELRYETVKLKAFKEVLKFIREKYGAYVGNCDQLFINEHMPDNSVRVLLEHDEGVTTIGNHKVNVNSTKPDVDIPWGDFGKDCCVNYECDDEEETLKEIGEALDFNGNATLVAHATPRITSKQRYTLKDGFHV